MSYPTEAKKQLKVKSSPTEAKKQLEIKSSPTVFHLHHQAAVIAIHWDLAPGLTYAFFLHTSWVLTMNQAQGEKKIEKPKRRKESPSQELLGWEEKINKIFKYSTLRYNL